MRWAYYMMAIINFCLSVVSIWSLPYVHNPSEKTWSRRLIEDIDLVGALLMSCALGLLMYVLSMATSSYRNAGHAQDVVLLVVSVLLLAAFPCWVHIQERKGRPALIPNRLWRKASFTSICIAVFFCWTSMNAIEYFTTL